MFDKEDEEDASIKKLTVLQPKYSKRHYEACAAIDQHNFYRQDILRIERETQTKTWDK